MRHMYLQNDLLLPLLGSGATIRSSSIAIVSVTATVSAAFRRAKAIFN